MCCGSDKSTGNGLGAALALLTVLAIVQLQATAEIRMPAIVDDNFSPDMGTMFGRWPLQERTRSLPATTAAEGPGQPSPRCCKRQR
ncbi:hypothetical protein NXT3_PB00279 (plasmid) [Sinorhizobium fredii]|uniref:Uncharacterized protein n=1 Tax=Rhizobium fredii TaxID=380 RepID=A0A2L0HC08_RHIFR|nr:hypothetical protein NXT3_PB00279 [Sinorhizobium fredii]